MSVEETHDEKATRVESVPSDPTLGSTAAEHERQSPMTEPTRHVCPACGAVHDCHPPAVCSRAMFEAQEVARVKDGELYATAYAHGQKDAHTALAALRAGLRAVTMGLAVRSDPRSRDLYQSLAALLTASEGDR